MRLPIRYLAASISIWGLATSAFAAAQEEPAIGDPTPSEYDEIVVTAPRGVVPGMDVERELSEEEILSYRADTVAELRDRIARETGGRGIVLMVNGKIVTETGSVDDFPPEALERAQVLPPDAAAKLGLQPDRRVVNLVLKPKFEGLTGVVAAKAPTAGGTSNLRGSAQVFFVSGSTRGQLELRYSREAALLEDSRSVSSLGQRDEGVARTLIPQSEVLAGTFGATLPLGRFSASIRATGTVRNSTALLGYPRAPDGPGAYSDVVFPGGLDPLRQSGRGYDLGMALSLVGKVRSVDMSFETRGAFATDNEVVDRYAADTNGAYRVIPYASRSRARSLSANLFVRTPIFSLPAGPTSASLLLSLARNWNDGSVIGAEDILRTSDSLLRGSLSIQVPIASKSSDVLAPLGDLSLVLSGGGNRPSGGSVDSFVGFQAVWTPLDFINISGGRASDRYLASRAARTGPIITTPGVRVLDPIRGKLVEVEQISGGNTALPSTRRTTDTFSVELTVPGPASLMMGAAYAATRTTGAALPLPALSADVEAAFPDRFVRDGSGQLVRLDVRPISASTTEKSLSSRFSVGFLSKAGTGSSTGSMNRGANRARLDLTHKWVMSDRITFHSGLPALERTDGYAGRVVPHQIGLALDLNLLQANANLAIDRESPSYARSITQSATGDLRYAARTVATLSITKPIKFNPEKELSLKLQVYNLLDDPIRVSNASGATPVGLLPDDLDPIGRTISLQLRSLF